MVYLFLYDKILSHKIHGKILEIDGNERLARIIKMNKKQNRSREIYCCNAEEEEENVYMFYSLHYVPNTITFIYILL